VICCCLSNSSNGDPDINRVETGTPFYSAKIAVQEGFAMRSMFVMTVAAVSVITASGSAPARAGDFIMAPGLVFPGYLFPPAREPAPGTARALDGVRNGTNRYERERHGGPEIDLSGRPPLTGRFREFQY